MKNNMILITFLLLISTIHTSSKCDNCFLCTSTAGKDICTICKTGYGLFNEACIKIETQNCKDDDCDECFY